MSNPETKTPPTIAELAAANDHIGIWIEMKRNAAAEALAKFQAKLAKDPAYAMEWGSDAIEAAGWMRVIATLDHARREGYADPGGERVDRRLIEDGDPAALEGLALYQLVAVGPADHLARLRLELRQCLGGGVALHLDPDPDVVVGGSQFGDRGAHRSARAGPPCRLHALRCSSSRSEAPGLRADHHLHPGDGARHQPHRRRMEPREPDPRRLLAPGRAAEGRPGPDLPQDPMGATAPAGRLTSPIRLYSVSLSTNRGGKPQETETKMTNPSTSFLIALRQSLISQIPTVRASRDRELARETVLRIRQLTGMLELRGSC